MASIRLRRCMSVRPRRSATPYSVTITPASARAWLAGPLSSATIRLAVPAVDGSAITGTPPSDLAAAHRTARGRLAIHRSGEVDLDGRVDGDERALGGKHCRVVGIAGVPELNRGVGGGERDQPPGAHQEASHHKPRVEALPGPGHDASFDQLGD